MAFTINTNISSMQAQEYLRVTGEFQAKTINRVTSGLRIVSSGDDAAGLAIANSFRSDQAVISQGIRNANDGLATLQTIDGGINNISKLLDRARTLATQSASGTFNGDRTVLQSEFSNVLSEIDRQAQAIGLVAGGDFAKNLSVFIGGGRAGSTSQIVNGSVSVDLTKSLVDSKSLGLGAYEATGAADIRSSSAALSTAIGRGTTANFVFKGAGFSTGTTVDVDISAVGNEAQLVDAINARIQAVAVANPGSAFATAGISAALSADGKNLVFNSSGSAFHVDANNAAAQDLMGAQYTNSGGTKSVSVGYTATGAGETQVNTLLVRDSGGTLRSVNLDVAASTNQAAAVAAFNTALAGNVYTAGIFAVADGANIRFMSASTDFELSIGDGSAAAGLNGGTRTTAGSSDYGSGGALDIATVSGAKTAVDAISRAVNTLGAAQATVGKGQNQLNYAVSLASTQLTNLAASESRIRDADLALEAANLSKAQILQQAGIAALAQANSAPQAVLSLLRG